jgi:hypothetical protein
MQSDQQLHAAPALTGFFQSDIYEMQYLYASFSTASTGFGRRITSWQTSSYGETKMR